jgi:Fur family ferric uptake transcriptional regulator
MKTTKHNTTLNLIKDIIINSEVALSHKELQEELGNDFNRVTIYRSLDKLMESGSIHKVVNIDGVAKFAACSNNCKHETLHHHHNHVHFSCTNCNEVTCLENVVPTFNLPPNYQLEELNFTISGICPNCK